MDNYSTQLIKLLSKNDEFESSIKEFMRSNLENAINELLKTELTVFLNYDYYKRSDTIDSRNGYYTRTYETSYGKLNLSIPRDRLCEFKPKIIDRYDRHDDTTTSTVLKLFGTGLTNGEIADVVDALYKRKYSRGTISNITNELSANIEKFKNRKIKSHYPVVYTDATAIPIRRDTVEREMLYIAVGITINGNKEILGYKIAPTESASTWKELLEDLKKRGLEKVNLFVTDGLCGYPEVVEELFDKPRIQRCLVHIARNIYNKARTHERKEIMEDFKAVYNKQTRKEAEKELDTFIEKWKKYPSLENMLKNNPYIFTFYDFPKSIWSSIYTTNLIESLNKQIKKLISHKEQFPGEESLEKIIVTFFENFNLKFMDRVHKGFGLINESEWEGAAAAASDN